MVCHWFCHRLPILLPFSCQHAIRTVCQRSLVPFGDIPDPKMEPLVQIVIQTYVARGHIQMFPSGRSGRGRTGKAFFVPKAVEGPLPPMLQKRILKNQAEINAVDADGGTKGSTEAEQAQASAASGLPSPENCSPTPGVVDAQLVLVRNVPK